MKKILSILLLVCAFGMSAQVQTFNTQVKFNNVPAAGAGDTLVLVQGADKIMKKVGKSTFSTTPVTPTLQAVTIAGNTTNTNVIINNNTLRVANTVGGTDERIVIESDGITFVPDAVEYVGKLSLPDVSGESVAWNLPELSGTIGLVEQDFGEYGSYSFGGQYNSYPSLKRLYFQANGGGIDGFTNKYSLNINPEEGASMYASDITGNDYAGLGATPESAYMYAGTVSANGNLNFSHEKLKMSFASGASTDSYSFSPTTLGVTSNDFDYIMPAENGTIALKESTDLQSVLNAGSISTFNTGMTNVTLPNAANSYLSIDSTNSISSVYNYYSFNLAHGQFSAQTGTSSGVSTYEDKTIKIQGADISLQNKVYDLSTDDDVSYSQIDAKPDNVKLIAYNATGTNTSTVTVHPNDFHYTVTNGTDEATMYFNYDEGLGIVTNNTAAALFKADNVTADRTLQAPNESGTIALTKYKVYTALLTQSGTDAPTVTVLENTLGASVNWTYQGVGRYRGTSTGAFVTDKTYATIQQSTYGDDRQINAIDVESVNYFQVYTFNSVGAADSMLNKTSVEIRVYN